MFAFGLIFIVKGGGILGHTTIEKEQSLLSIFFIFAGYVLSVTAFMVGGNVGNQTTLWSGIAAIIVGIFPAAYLQV